MSLAVLTELPLPNVQRLVASFEGVDPKRVWKGPWRWFSEALLDCCEPLEVVKAVTVKKRVFFGCVCF